MPKYEKTDVYAEVTDRIIAALEEGTVPWRKPWSAPGEAPRNPVSGTVYRGINPFLLELTASACGYSDPRWLTFKQAAGLNAKVRKGERSTLVVFWKMLRGVDERTGELRTIPMLRHYRVFNVAQIDGLDLEPIGELADHEPIDACQSIIAGMPSRPTIGHGGNSAFYHPALDAVQLPELGSFVDPEAYYATAFHELVHATGHESRLDRGLDGSHAFGSGEYGKEELVAELGAAMICGQAGISPATVDRSASYIASWLRTLKADPKMLVGAAGKAQKAADWILAV
jgi:antirestriction protein ArdC